MNILFVAECDWFNSVVFDLHILAERMSLKGHTVYAIDYNHWQTWEGGFKTTTGYSLYPDAKVTVGRCSGAKNQFMALAGPSTAAVREAFNRWHIDVVVLYAGLAMGTQAVIEARRRHIPVVCRIVDRRQILWPGKWWRWLSAQAEGFTFRHADLILPVTANYGEYAVTLGADESLVKGVLRYPVDTDLFKPEGTQHSHDILWMGNIYPFTGLDLLAAQMPRIRDQVPDARLVIIGYGSPEAKGKIVDAVVSGGLGLMGDKLRPSIASMSGSVHFAGAVPFRELPAHINRAGCCVNIVSDAPDASDVFPAKIIQYMACGRPVVSTASRGVMRTVPPGVGVDYRLEADGMAESIIRLLTDPQAAEWNGMLGRAYSVQHFDAVRITDEFERHLLEVIK